MSEEIFTAAISRHIWDTKYRLRDAGGPLEQTVEDTWRRIARALAAVERDPRWEERFRAALAGFRFLPGGRIQAGAGTDRRVTLFNCFVMGTVEDSLDRISGRPSGRAGLHPRQANPGRAAQLQPLGARQRRARAGGEGRRTRRIGLGLTGLADAW